MLIWTGIAGLFVHFIYIGLYIITPKAPWSITIGSAIWADPNLQYIVSYYHLFGFLWALWFINGFSQVALAGAIGTWYWTMDKTESMRSPVIRSVRRTCRYHMGSIAVGSLLIALVELIRILFYQFARQVSKTHISWLKYLIACMQCMLACVSMIVKFINKNAYIYIGTCTIILAIKGKAFFTSAGAATGLLIRNAARTIAINFVADFILLTSKVIVSAITGFGIYAYLTYAPNPYGVVRNPYVIVIVGTIAAFIV